MTTLVTTINNTLCIVTSLEDMSTAYDAHQAQVDSAIIDYYGEASEASDWGDIRVKVDFTTYVDGKYSYEGYYITDDRCYWDCGDHDYYWSIRIKGIDYDVEDDLEDEEEGWE